MNLHLFRHEYDPRKSCFPKKRFRQTDCHLELKSSFAINTIYFFRKLQTRNVYLQALGVEYFAIINVIQNYFRRLTYSYHLWIDITKLGNFINMYMQNYYCFSSRCSQKCYSPKEAEAAAKVLLAAVSQMTASPLS